MSGSGGLWRWFRRLPTKVQVGAWVVLAVALLAAVVGGQSPAPAGAPAPGPAPGLASGGAGAGTRPTRTTAPGATVMAGAGASASAAAGAGVGAGVGAGNQAATTTATTAPATTASVAAALSGPTPGGPGGLAVGQVTGGDPPVPPAGSCHGAGRLPDPRCTPGATNPSVTQGDIASTICMAGWTATVRPPESYTEPLKRRQMISYGDAGPVSAYEEDHLLPLELGGAPSDPRNLWPEPGASPNAKDKVENAGREAVCSGRITLAAARRAIAGDWVTFGVELGLGRPAAPAKPGATTTTTATSTTVATTTTTTTTTTTITTTTTTTVTTPNPPPQAATLGRVSDTAPSGNYYRPGEFCPRRDLGSTITDPYGIMTCRKPAGGGQPHWGRS
ncbi:MAG: hypothetical protein ACRD0J_14450 [Acidimicrobiales bacterium]